MLIRQSHAHDIAARGMQLSEKPATLLCRSESRECVERTRSIRAREYGWT